MDLNRLFQMLGNRLFRQLLSRGISKGIDMAAGPGKPKSEMSPEERNQAKQAKLTARKARDMAKLTRRIGR
jgi:hypothetical protein